MKARSLPALLWISSAAAAGAQAPPDTTVDSTNFRLPRGEQRLSQILAAHYPGVLVSGIPGVAGAGARIRIRGPQTLADTRAPLILVDGIRVEAAASSLGFESAVTGMPRLDDFTADDIERIEVIPGPAAAGRYGPDAANGVLLIQTRAGAGPARWELTLGGTTRGFDDWPTFFAGMDGDSPNVSMRYGGCIILLQAQGSCGLDSIRTFAPDMLRRQFRRGWRQDDGFQVHGGNPRIGYYVSANVETDDGIVRLADTEAARLRALGQTVGESVLRPDADERWNVRANLDFQPFEALEVRLRGARFVGDQRVLPIERVLRAGEDECCNPNTDSIATAFAQLFHAVKVQELNRWTGSLEARWRPLAGLTTRALIGEDAAEQNGRSTQPQGPVLSEDASETTSRTVELAAEYDRALSARIGTRTSAGVRWTMLDGRHFGGIRIGTPPSFISESSFVERWRETGVFFYEQITLDRALELTAGLRHDAFRWGAMRPPAATHPSVALAWLVRGADAPVVSSLRLRAGYGSAGRRTVADFAQERTTEATAGFDATAFGGRASVSATLYDMRSDAYGRPIGSIFAINPDPFPPPPVRQPGSLISNRGIEITLAGRVVSTSALDLDLRLAAWGNRNRLERLDVAPYSSGFIVSQWYFDGFPVGTYLVSDLSFTDANGDGLLSRSEVMLGNAAPSGSPHPSHGAMLSLGMRLGSSVRLSGVLEYRAGAQLANFGAMMRCFDRCRESVDPTTPLADQAPLVWTVLTPRFLEDADFLKLRGVSITFDPPRSVLRLLRADAASITLTGRNLATWTGYSLGDPEVLTPEPAVGSLEPIAGHLVVPPLPEWSLRVRLTY